VAVRVDHADEGAGKLRQIGAQLIGQAVAGAGVDDHQAGRAADDADRLVQRLIPAHPHAVADLAPDRSHAPSRTAVPDAVTMSIEPLPTVS
jgi:hypothetical protein